jgi:hypothetical protein
MIDRFRTRYASFVVSHFTRPTMLVIQCWLWLAAKSRDKQDNRRCLHAVLRLDPDNQPAPLALLLFDPQRPTGPLRARLPRTARASFIPRQTWRTKTGLSHKMTALVVTSRLCSVAYSLVLQRSLPASTRVSQVRLSRFGAATSGITKGVLRRWSSARHLPSVPC